MEMRFSVTFSKKKFQFKEMELNDWNLSSNALHLRRIYYTYACTVYNVLIVHA